MKNFMDKDFLLETETAKHLFHDYAEKMPLADYHCHLNPREIYEDRRFDDLVQVWLGGLENGVLAGDHYKWRMMRSHGIEEDYITGNKPAYERFLKLAEALEMAIGNPMYHWCHLELQFFFGVTEPLTSESAPRIWEHCNKLLREDPELTARGMIRKANVAFIGTTDDPIDTLEWHEKIEKDPTITCKVCPSFRPDKAVNLHKPGFADYIRKLGEVVGKELTCTKDVCEALAQRIRFFYEHGCRASDHGLDYVPFRIVSDAEADAVFSKAMNGEAVTAAEAEGYQTKVLLSCAKLYRELGIVMQLHYSCLRNTNARMFKLLGADAGFDTIAQNSCGNNIAAFLSAMDESGNCPKVILYSLNPVDNELLGSLIGSFQGTEVPGKIQHGSAWWFNDNKTGMEQQMISLANLGILGNFIGMLTDSRSFLSYTRHDYFRRILCNLVGNWVENGEYPNNDAALKKIVEGISFLNAKRYFDI
ncbi:MAG: glucuronate isomerase [Oscillospiraceae bacterium]|nr:glucuronate isomerase [Oscillospiraceae bacterium]